MIENHFLLRGSYSLGSGIERLVYEHGRGLSETTTNSTIIPSLTNDDFPMPYETGYIVFILLTCAVGIGSACIIAFAYSKVVELRVLFFIVSLFIAAMSSIIAWAITLRVYADPYSRLYSSSIAVISVAGIGLVCGFGLVDICFIEVVDPDWWQILACPLMMISTTFLLIPGLVFLAVYSRKMAETENYSYFGPMYITGYNIEFDGDINCHHGQIPGEGFYGNVGLNWGMAWGCPEDETKTCKTYARDDQCTVEVCQRNPDTDGRTDAKVCILEKYNAFRCGHQPMYDITVLPQFPTSDGGCIWPSAVAYGDCLSCNATFNNPWAEALDFKRIGTSMSISGACITGVTLIASLFRSSPLENELQRAISEYEGRGGTSTKKQCSECGKKKFRNEYSKTQWNRRSSSIRRCRSCIVGEWTKSDTNAAALVLASDEDNNTCVCDGSDLSAAIADSTLAAEYHNRYKRGDTLTMKHCAGCKKDKFLEGYSKTQWNKKWSGVRRCKSCIAEDNVSMYIAGRKEKQCVCCKKSRPAIGFWYPHGFKHACKQCVESSRIASSGMEILNA